MFLKSITIIKCKIIKNNRIKLSATNLKYEFAEYLSIYLNIYLL